MIAATSNEWGTVKVNGICNRGETSGVPWLIVLGSGISTFFYVAIASHPHEALDVYADSSHARMTKLDAPPPSEEEDRYIQLGNFGEWHDLSNTHRNSCVRCKVNYFAKKDSLEL